jgi:hypothetical protein
MRTIYICIITAILLILNGIHFHFQQSIRNAGQQTMHYVQAGAPADATTPMWVYLGGLLADIKYIGELEDIQTIDRIGNELGISFLIPLQQHRCPELRNMLCWPQDNPDELWQTYHEIATILGDRPVTGYIGFSNGGFFLNLFAQQKELGVPLIAIGAAGSIYTHHGPHNRLHLLISPEDTWHYEPALSFYDAAKDSNVEISLHEYAGGHSVPYDTLKNILALYR